jgi:phospholipid transport system substrate-binding protein
MSSKIKWPASAGKWTSLCLALLLAAGAGALTPAAAAASNPEQPVEAFYEVLLSNMKQGGMLGESGRYARLAPVVDRTFDLPFMTRLAVGPYWETLNQAQQQQLMAAFAHYVAATYADQFDSYSGQQLQVTGERPYGADVMVQTKIANANGETTKLDYRMHQNEGAWEISDIYLDGTISQLAVHRSEFHSILRRYGVDGLVIALNRKTDLLSNVARSS